MKTEKKQFIYCKITDPCFTVSIYALNVHDAASLLNQTVNNIDDFKLLNTKP